MASTAYWVVVLSDWRFARMFGFALGNGGNYIGEPNSHETPLSEEAPVLFRTEDDAISCARDSVKMSRGMEGRMGLGVMHTVMLRDEWLKYRANQKVRHASQKGSN